VKTYFISDMHFGHKNIIRYENRPFGSVEEMDAAIIKNWNNTVGKHDQVFILGDFAFYPAEKIKEIVSLLQGRKTLILGNHDTKSVKTYAGMDFEFVSKYPIIYREFYILSHAPLYVNINMPYFNLHGHLHSKNMSGQYFNVSVEQIGYTPILFEEIQKKAGIK